MTSKKPPLDTEDLQELMKMAEDLMGNLTPEQKEALVADLEEEAEKGDIESQLNLAYLYLDGDFVAENMGEAIRWFTKAAEQDDMEAQFTLGSIYLHGSGVEADAEKAAEWFTKAAEQGDPDSQYHLGLMYFNGMGVPQDDMQGYEWVMAAAEEGLPEAQFCLGTLAEHADEGNPTDLDIAEAREWYERAAAQDHEEAIEALARLNKTLH